MFSTINSNGLSLTKILSGISKTLNIANQIIPLYNQAKPLFNNTKNILSILKDINDKPTQIKKTATSTINNYNGNIKKTEQNLNQRPVFFH